MSRSSGRVWPHAIGASIIFIFGACVATIVVTSKVPVEKSDTYMMGYHEEDAKANDIINDRIEFNKKYKIEYLTDDFNSQNCVVKYKVGDINSNSVNNADIKVVVTRPDNHKYDQELINPAVEAGVYTFSPIKLPLEGRWDIMAKVSVDGVQRFYNIKTDTRSKEIIEY